MQLAGFLVLPRIACFSGNESFLICTVLYLSIQWRIRISKWSLKAMNFYTKVHKNVPPEESSGWTIVLMDRASRFIWEMNCGNKDRALFKKAIETMAELVDQTEDITLLTDGERRYGNILFEICHELLRTGKPGRPRKTLKKGVTVRVKTRLSST